MWFGDGVWSPVPRDVPPKPRVQAGRMQEAGLHHLPLRETTGENKVLSKAKNQASPV